MSTRKRPLAELRQAQTPTRYAPSTPHAIRALQQRSGAKTRSVRTHRVTSETVRPDSARGILRRFAKITAPATKRTVRTPVVAAGKENEVPTDDDEEDERALKRPRMTFNIEESIDEDEEDEGDEEDSELPTAPTPSILPDDHDPTMTFKAIDFARNEQPMSDRTDRRKSRLSFAGQNDTHLEEDEDPTILSEMGRRAMSEDPTGRLSRYSFGSIRMSDFGTELEIRRDSGGKDQTRVFENEYDVIGFDDDAPLLDGETENLGRLRRSLSAPADDTTMPVAAVDESFRLETPEDDEQDALSNQVGAAEPRPVEVRDEWEDESDVGGDGDPPAASPEQTRQLTHLEAASQAATSRTRRKRQKLTRHGTLVPSLPSSLIKRIAIETQVNRGSRKPVLGAEHMRALEQATEWFFEQVGEDLAAYANHGRRKKRLDSSDMLLLMRRQRILGGEGDLQQLAKHWLPKDVLAGLDLPEKP